ncbi:4-hydroxy-tetrahydrodipicolinate synthase [Bdellovibrionota bacterium]
MFEGVSSAIPTPFLNGEVDEKALRQHIEEQLEAGIHGIVPCGTTGESPTLSLSEKKRVIEITIDQVNNRAYVIAGTGTNNTKESVELTKWAKEAGANGALVITPYYNKPTQRGLFEHFKTIAATDIPIVLYNVPSRTSVSLDPGTLEQLSDIKNIVAIKEATGSMKLGSEFLRASNGKITLLSGDDGTFLELLKTGGKGCISVVSNVAPKEMVEMYNAFKNNDRTRAEEINKELTPLMDALFIETNPIPTKQTLALMGKMGAELRLPLCEMNDENLGKLKEVLSTAGFIN